uniref:Uncharacterized protein n=1 Tax=Amphimedon queenslandica TaxID=400682 RepID=A0A1X7SWP7_AMPQE
MFTATELKVFATKDILPKTFVAEYKGVLLNKEEASRKEEIYKLMKQDKFFLLDIGPNKTIDATNSIGTYRPQRTPPRSEMLRLQTSENPSKVLGDETTDLRRPL